MDKERAHVEKQRFECRCPTPTEFIVYTSAVVVLLAVLLPLEVNFGLVAFLRNNVHMVSDAHDGTLSHYVLEKLGVISVKRQASSSKGDQTKTMAETVFTKEELKQYSGANEKIYLAFLGKVYDVTGGRKHYGEGGSYSFFSGKDGTRGYVTGQFDENGLIDNIKDLEPTQYLGLLKWRELYEKQYIYIGKLEGYFYDSHGNPKEGVNILEDGVKHGRIVEKEESDDNTRYPQCNSYYSQPTGAEVWCTKQSGGTARDWIGVPRRFFKLGSKTHRCACVDSKDLSDPRFKEYEGCMSHSERCKVVE